MISRCDSAAIVPNTSELLPEPETPVNTVSARFGISTLTSLRLLTRAPTTRITSWLPPAAGRGAAAAVAVVVRVLICSRYPRPAALRFSIPDRPPGCARMHGRTGAQIEKLG